MRRVKEGLNRRTFLRGTLHGAAVSVGLPFLDVFLNTNGDAMAATGAPLPRRFGTWFFVGEAPAGDVTVDGGEILSHRWTTPRQARERRDRGQISLAPPTWITLEQLEPYRDAAEALAGIALTPTERFATRIVIDGDRVLALYHGDHAYDTGEPGGNGPLHRLTMGADPWSYQRTTNPRTPS